MNLRCFIPTIAAAMLSTSPLHAELVTVQFTGEIGALTSSGSIDLSDDFFLGSPVNGYFIYENSIPDFDFFSGESGGWFPTAFIELGLNIRDSSLQTIDNYGITTTTPEDLVVLNDGELTTTVHGLWGDHFYTILFNEQISAPAIDGASPRSISVELLDASGQSFPDNATANSLTPTYDFSCFTDGLIQLAWPNFPNSKLDITVNELIVLPECSPDREIENLTNLGPGGEFSPWTIIDPAGTQLVFPDNNDWTGQNPDGSEELFIMNLATRVITQITNSTSLAHTGNDASFTDDGSTLVFQMADNATNTEEIFIYTTADQVLTPVLSAGSAFLQEPRITDDATRIFFRSNTTVDSDPATPYTNADGSSEIFVYNTTNGRLTQLTNTLPSDDLFFYSASGDGSTVVFESTGDLIPSQNVDGSREFFMIDLGTGILTQLTNGTDNQLRMGTKEVLTSDGTLFAFVSGRDLTGENPDNNEQVFIINTNTLAVNQLTNNVTQFFPKVNGISRNGSTVIFETFENLTGENPQNIIQFMKVDVETQVITQITNFQFGNENLQASVNSDGTLVAFEASRSPLACVPSVGSQLYLATMPTTQPCPADFDDDNTVGTSDFFALLQNWGTCADPQACPWDIAPGSGDWGVGTDDFFLLLQSWGPCD